MLAKKGKSKKINLQVINDKFNKLTSKRSFDIKDFQLSNDFKKLSLEDGAATLTDFTISSLFKFISKTKNEKIIICGGGRKNNFIIKKLKYLTGKNKIFLIDDYGINGDFIESQAFAYFAIRSFLKLPISYPKTTGCKKPNVGGSIIKSN